MSKLGYYVHNKAKNYLAYGPYRIPKEYEQGQGEDNITSYWAGLHTRIKNKVIKQKYTNTKLQKMQNQYNEIRSLILKDKDYEIVRDKIIDMLIEQSKKNDLKVNFETGAVTASEAKALSNKITQVENQTISPKKKQISLSYISTLTARFKEAFEDIQNISDIETQKKLEKNLTDFYQCFNQMIKEGQAIDTKNLVGIKKNETVISRGQARAIIDNINKILGVYSTQGLGNIIGKFEEYTAAAVELKALGLSAEEIVNNIEKEIKKHGGQKQTKTMIISDMVKIHEDIGKTFSQKSQGKVYTWNGEKYQFSIKGASQKMDALFVYTPSKQSLRLSVKNYNLKSGYNLKLVSGTPLTACLLELTDYDDINHFLNILANHKNTQNDPIEAQAVKKLTAIRKTYGNPALMNLILYIAFKGRQSGKADVFVLNDNSSKNGVKFYDIGSLINKIIMNNDILNQTIITPKISKINLNNTYIKDDNPNVGIQKRLGILIAKAHQQKISVSISPNVFKNNL